MAPVIPVVLVVQHLVMKAAVIKMVVQPSMLPRSHRVTMRFAVLQLTVELIVFKVVV